MSTTFSSIDRVQESPTPTTIHQLLCDQCYERRSIASSNGRLARFEIVIDCSGVNMISSEDLNSLIRFHSRLRHESAALVLTKVPSHIVEIFSLTRLNRLFSVHEAIETA